MSGDQPAPWDTAETSDADDLIRLRVHELARVAGVPAPPVDVVPPKKHLLPASVRHWPENRLVASSTLAAMPSGARDWHLASALGWWTSERAREQKSLLTALRLALAVLFCSLLVSGQLDGLPHWLALTSALLIGEAGYVITPWTLRRQQRALDAAAAEILALAGIDPASAARAALQGEPRPSWWKRLHSYVPTPQDRIAAAERRNSRPAPPLH